MSVDAIKLLKPCEVSAVATTLYGNSRTSHRRRLANPIFASLAFLVTADAGETLNRAPMLPHDIPCNAKAGKVMEVTLGVPAKAFTVTGKLKVVAARGDKTYFPSATVFVNGKGGVVGTGFKAYIDPKEPDQLQLGILGAGESVKITSWPWRLSPVQFIVAITVEGELKVDAGGLVATLPLDGFEAESIYIACSTGKFEFQSVSAQAW